MREARLEMGLTQEELAQELGVKQNTVYRWESGMLPISKTVELALKALLDEHRRKSTAKRKEKRS